MCLQDTEGSQLSVNFFCPQFVVDFVWFHCAEVCPNNPWFIMESLQNAFHLKTVSFHLKTVSFHYVPCSNLSSFLDFFFVFWEEVVEVVHSLWRDKFIYGGKELMWIMLFVVVLLFGTSQDILCIQYCKSVKTQIYWIGSGLQLENQGWTSESGSFGRLHDHEGPQQALPYWLSRLPGTPMERWLGLTSSGLLCSFFIQVS